MRQKKLVYYGKKCLIFLISVFILSVVVFYVARLAPGDPLISYYGDRTEKMSPEEREWAMEKLGLNKPISVQYVKWVKNAFHGEFGISFKYKQDVLEVIGGRIGNTLLLGGIGFIIMFAGALLLGILCAWYENRLADRILCKLGTISSCIPEFWMALVLILIFSVNLKILPSSGAYSTGKAGDVGDRVIHLIMPLTIVVLEHLWYYAYMIRNKILEEVRADYVLLAKTKGLDKKKLMFRHCVRNVMPAYLSIMAIAVPHVLGGTYVVESVFSYPGIGALSYESARSVSYTHLARDRFYYGRELFYHREYVEAVDNLLKFLQLPEGFVENQAEACRVAARCCYELKQNGMALEFLYRGLTYRTPSGELCCDIGKHFFDRKKWEQAVFWYRNALQVSENAKTGGFVEKECYGYIPCIQLSVCWYYLGDIEKAFQYHCQAGTYKPYGREFLKNQQYFISVKQ